MRNTSKIKNVWIGLGKSSLWNSTFIVVQMLTVMGFMLHKIFTDTAYADLFYCLVKPIYDATDNSIDRAMQMMTVQDMLFEDILMPAMITADILIMAIFCIVINRKSIAAFITGRKNDFKEKRMEFCRKISNMALSKSCFDFVFLALGLNGIISISSIIVQKLLPENIGIMHIVINSSSVILSFAAASVKSELVGYGIMASLWLGYSLYRKEFHNAVVVQQK